jgi:mannose-1-phosphate guanylyltransferase/mannose-6-phosphate isomerase
MIVPVILSGGSGTRLWPLSRAMYPKQFIRFFSEKGESLLGATLKRARFGKNSAAPIIMCNNDHRFLVSQEVTSAGLEAQAIILEPIARNTAPAIAVAALAAMETDKDAVLVVMPSDHVVQDEQRFTESILRAADIAAAGKLVLFGIPPSEPHTGYGYIRRGVGLGGASDAFAVDAFFEKPDRKTAETYVAAGTYFWNSGIFVLNACTFLEELERLEPRVLNAAREALAKASEDLGFLRLEREAFSTAPNISVDYAVMEKTNAAAMLPIDVGWNDLGSWASLWEVAPHDQQDNAIHGDAILTDTSGCYVHSERSFVATIGVKDLVIVDTPDALLVADKDRAQDVSSIVARLKQAGRTEHQQHLRNYRPWGYFETLNMGPRFQVKLLHVNPGGKLSMQMHHHRSEHWIVVQGTAKVTIANDERLVQENESTYITATEWHRLENPGKVPLEMIEVQLGTYLGEDDIVRSEDDYHRASDETK